MERTGTPVTSEALLARVDQSWRAFRHAVRDVGRAAMERATTAGWTYRDLLAHVAAWEDLTARRLRTLRLEGRRTCPDEARDVDAFNARVVESRRLVGPEALLDELDAAHRGLVRELRRLSDEQVAQDDSWVVTIVAGNTYDHYREHAGELATRQ